eukprot:gnl/TRDRNA2_/TRDRNA2_85569_c0_seq1.p1 gnl/TRDRNA2_/TRDRNA2_85569_c0~~gnl/TRDRNA2_/TRDRNA2_85569_c0_seq1.p1  ORF type:complete len:771 (-),score=181.23 gnl/TRDRNA2_/TRDRNA2_85569_c0_seq1:97-2409(-)
MSSGHSAKHGGGSSPTAGSPSQRPVPPKQQGKPNKPPMQANFLLNFQRPSNQRASTSGYAPPPRRSQQNWKQWQSTPKALGRGRFVQSSFRVFVDDVTPDVVEAVLNADALINWPHVRRVDLLCEEHPKCPICLEQDIVVPKITRCGHVFCLPCVMRYFMVLQEQNERHQQRCPVCNEMVGTEDLRSVRFQMTRPLREGDRLTFCLASRETSSVVARPSWAKIAAVEDNSPVQLPSESDEGWHFSRMVRLSPGEARRTAAMEMEALRRYRPHALSVGDTELLPSIAAASKLLENQWQELFGCAAPPGNDDESTGTGWGCSYVELEPSCPPSYATKERQQGSFPLRADAAEFVPARLRPASAEDDQAAVAAAFPEEWDDIEAEDEDDDACDDEATCSPALPSAAVSPAQGPVQSPSLSATTSPKLEPQSPARSRVLSGASAGGAKVLSFYQAEDGRLVFFQPFFTKILLHEHEGRWDALPERLPNLRLERIQDVAVTEELRRRHRFLSHLPAGSSISLAEVDLRQHMSRETKAHFSEEFEKRRQQRKKEQVRDRRQAKRVDRRVAEEEEKYWNTQTRLVIQAAPTKEDFATPLPGREADEALPEAAEGSGEEEKEDASEGPTLAKILKERISAKDARKAKEDAAAGRGPPLPAGSGHYPTLGGSGQADGSGKGCAWGPGRGSSRCGAASAPAQPAAAAPSSRAEPPSEVIQFQEAPNLGEALQQALLNAKDAKSSTGKSSKSEADEDAGEAAGAGKKKGQKAKATKIRLFG